MFVFSIQICYQLPFQCKSLQYCYQDSIRNVLILTCLAGVSKSRLHVINPFFKLISTILKAVRFFYLIALNERLFWNPAGRNIRKLLLISNLNFSLASFYPVVLGPILSITLNSSLRTTVISFLSLFIMLNKPSSSSLLSIHWLS